MTSWWRHNRNFMKMYFFIKCLMSSAILLLAVLKSDIAEFRKIIFKIIKTIKIISKSTTWRFYRKYLEKHSYSQKTMLYDDVQMTSLRNADVTAIMYVPNYCTIFGRFCGNYFNIGRVIFYIHIYYKFCLFLVQCVGAFPLILRRRGISRSP